MELMENSTTRAAFFDVDETLLPVKSMVAFLEYFLRHWQGDTGPFQQAITRLRTQAESGIPRVELNRMYYRLFTGMRYADLMAAGRSWYGDYRERPEVFLTATLTALRDHQAWGDLVVLVSGSFHGCLDPLAAELRADHILCTELIVDSSGRLTGEVVLPMIGPNKAAAIAQTIDALGLDRARCYCYGDHASDLDMLSEVGHPRVVGDDPVLLAHARQHHWTVLPAHPTCPAPVRATTPSEPDIHLLTSVEETL